MELFAGSLLQQASEFVEISSQHESEVQQLWESSQQLEVISLTLDSQHLLSFDTTSPIDVFQCVLYTLINFNVYFYRDFDTRNFARDV